MCNDNIMKSEFMNIFPEMTVDLADTAPGSVERAAAIQKLVRSPVPQQTTSRSRR